MIPLYKNLGKPHTLCLGHTLSIVKRKDLYMGYLGGFGHDGIWLMTGKTLTGMMPQRKLNMEAARWGSATYQKRFYMFATDQTTPKQIALWVSLNGLDFRKRTIICEGVNPFIFIDPNTGKNLLYYMKRRGAEQCIMVREAKNMGGLPYVKERYLMSKYATLGAPSMLYYNGRYYLTCEARDSNGAWVTEVYWSPEPDGDFKYVDNLMEAPCLFQHMIDDRLVVTYSQRIRGPWHIKIKELQL